MLQKLFVFLAWISLAYIAFVTLSPIALRPIAIHNHPAYERFAAYAILGILFVLAYPGRSWTKLCVVVGAAIALEALQHFASGRHGRPADLLEKASGGSFGVLSAGVVYGRSAASVKKGPPA